MKPNILYIDDEFQNLVSFKASFREEFNIITFESAKEGLELLRREPTNHIQIIISDQRMPVMTGDEFFAHIPETQQHATRILLTAFTDADAAKKALNKGGLNFLYNKPYDEDAFRKVLYQGCRLFNKKIQLENEVQETKNITKLQIKKLLIDHEERRDIFSEELHEELAQKLASLRFFSEALELSNDSPDFSDLMKQFNEILSKSISNVQDICFKVMPRSLKLGELKGSLIELIKKSNETSSINFKLLQCDFPKLSEGSIFFIYRVFDEILNSFCKVSNESIDIGIVVKDNLLITFCGISTIKNWKMEETHRSKIESYNGKITKKQDQLELLFDHLH
jgi:response regulator RpfG family c-di-GMP phosphodiesterase